ncbi:MAG: magnesium-translocating P-type ATPase [bacterium]|nr:magnesium-translocating P-type ATPase [bacterium]
MNRIGKDIELTQIADYAKYSNEDLLNEFKTSLKGLTDKEAKNRLRIFGLNVPAEKKKISAVVLLFSKVRNPLILILAVIALFSLFFGEIINTIFVSLMILVSVALEFSLEYRSGKAVEKLSDLVRTKVAVFRDGAQKEIDLFDIVPGDVVDLYAGDMVPADLRIVQANDLFINQASFTGESFPVEKTAEFDKSKKEAIEKLENIAFMGSSVISGTGLGVAVKTGKYTQFGEISSSLIRIGEETSFDKGIKQFTMLMIHLMLVLVVFIFFVILFLKQGVFKEALLFSLAVAVGITPEMLPMLVSINLSRGAADMAKKKVIVKRLNSIQNFGAMDVLCTDKTGTLTLDKIVMVNHYDVEGDEDREVMEYAYLNSSFQTGLKNLLDNAILKHEKIRMTGYQKVDEMPFDFSRRIMSVVVEKDGQHILVAKGAPEDIFNHSSHYYLNGKIHKIHDKIFSKVQEEYDKLSGQGFRVLAVAYKNIEKPKAVYSKNDENNLVLRGYLAFFDPAKPTVKESLRALEDLGIEIKVLTGDNEIITKKICRDVSLSVKGVVTGFQMDNILDAELERLVEKTTIFARLNPIQKERVIKALHRNNHTVGYLGDGINDAPSLKAADIGISVNNAVDIARESADIILLQKSLMVLKDGVLDGRKVFGNIIKYIKMGASSNFGNMISLTGATLFLPFLPMTPLQILFNNFLYDMGQLALPNDEVDKEYLAKPRPWNINFIKKFIFFIGPLSSIFDFLTFGIMLYVFNVAQNGNQELFHTGWFIESLFTQVLVIYVIRTNKIPFIQSTPNKFLIFNTLLILAIALGVIFSSLAGLFGFVALPPLYFIILFIMLVTYLSLVQIVKTWVVRKYGYQ